jgi:pimeloyl-ACP methyl ester carboxylesterase
MPEHLRLHANGLDFHALAEGPHDGPLVLLLHGFPELSRSWRHQLPALAAAGLRAVAPDLRGYGESGKQGPYDLRTLAADVAGLVRALDRERAAVVGHDWGGAAAWGAAMYEPSVVERLAVLDCPHPFALARELLVNRRQLRRSLYMLFFLLPWLPEWVLTRRGATAVGRSLRGGSYVRGVWPRDETALYQRAFLAPGVAHAALGYYRAAARSARRWRREQPPRVTAPVLILWGANDSALGLETIAPDRLEPYLASGNVPEVRVIEGAGHFLQNEAPQRVNAELLAWLAPATVPAQRERPREVDALE